jgi:hypothetical protein
MRVFCALAMIGLLAAPAYAQTQPVPQYGDISTPKSPSELEAERRAEAAYKRSLGNVPDATGPSDPWGNVRSDTPAKSTAKAAPNKRVKPANPAN